MARAARKKSKTGIYHIVLRGINKQTVFYDDEDKEVLLNRIKLTKEKQGLKIYAFCFMNNHIHLLIKETTIEIAKIMRLILSSYVFWYNSKYERVGNLFQDRYKSEPIENDEYLLCAARYIHQNAVKAGLVQDVSEYKWSSYGAYLTDKENMVDKHLILTLLQSREQYVKFMKESEEKKFIEPTDFYKISDDKLLKQIKKLLKINSVTEIYALSKTERYKQIRRILEIKGSNAYQVSRVTGISMGIIRGILA